MLIKEEKKKVNVGHIISRVARENQIKDDLIEQGINPIDVCDQSDFPFTKLKLTGTQQERLSRVVGMKIFNKTVNDSKGKSSLSKLNDNLNWKKGA